MKTIGLIGGLSWESTAEYYRIINEAVKERLGGFHSAKIILYSVDFAGIEEMQREARWAEAGRALIEAGRNIESGGADFGLICANTMHKLYDEVRTALSIPLIHIADVTALKVRAAGLKTIGLLGTKFTMEEGFYKDRLTRKHGLDVLIPETEDRDLLHHVLYNELCLGAARPDSHRALKEMMERLKDRGAEGIILGCTELPLFVKSGNSDSGLPLFDTTAIHALAAVDEALADGGREGKRSARF